MADPFVETSAFIKAFCIASIRKRVSTDAWVSEGGWMPVLGADGGRVKSCHLLLFLQLHRPPHPPPSRDNDLWERRGKAWQTVEGKCRWKEIRRLFLSCFKYQIMLDIWIFPKAHFHKIMPNYPERVGASWRDFCLSCNRVPLLFQTWKDPEEKGVERSDRELAEEQCDHCVSSGQRFTV